MKYIKLIFRPLACTSLIFFINSNSYADTAYVYCENENYNWEWLYGVPVNRTILFDSALAFRMNHVYFPRIVVEGIWKATMFNDRVIHYFVLNGGESVFLNLKEKCITIFGESFKYIHPQRNFFDYNNNYFAYTIDQNDRIEVDTNLFSTPTVGLSVIRISRD